MELSGPPWKATVEEEQWIVYSAYFFAPYNLPILRLVNHT